MAENEGPEPGGWELMRAIQSIKGSVDNMAKTTVSAEVFTLRVGTVDREIVALRAQQVIDRSELDEYKREQEKARSQIRLLIYGLLATPLVTLLVNFIANGGLNS